MTDVVCGHSDQRPVYKSVTNTGVVARMWWDRGPAIPAWVIGPEPSSGGCPSRLGWYPGLAFLDSEHGRPPTEIDPQIWRYLDGTNTSVQDFGATASALVKWVPALRITGEASGNAALEVYDHVGAFLGGVSIGYSGYYMSTTAVTDTSGTFNSASSIGVKLEIVANPVLQKIGGFGRLETVRGMLKIKDNQALEYIEGWMHVFA